MKKKTDAIEPANSEPKNLGGRPPNPEPTLSQRNQVQALSGFGLTAEEIAVVMDVGDKQLRRDYAPELRMGAAKADAGVLTNLYKIATGSTPQAVTAAIFWVKVRRRWHEVQRIIHGFDPEIVAGFVKQVVAILRRDLPEACPHCKTRLDLPKKIAATLQAVSQKMMEQLAPTEIVPITPTDQNTVDVRGEAPANGQGPG